MTLSSGNPFSCQLFRDDATSAAYVGFVLFMMSDIIMIVVLLAMRPRNCKFDDLINPRSNCGSSGMKYIRFVLYLNLIILFISMVSLIIFVTYFLYRFIRKHIIMSQPVQYCWHTTKYCLNEVKYSTQIDN